MGLEAILHHAELNRNISFGSLRGIKSKTARTMRRKQLQLIVYASQKVINYKAPTHFLQSVCANLLHLHVDARRRWSCIIDKLSILYKCTQ